MRGFIDLTGRKFGRLYVIKRSYPNNKWGRTMWLCKCDCGKEKIIYGYNLRGGHTKSCGCLQKEISGRPRLKYRVASMRKAISGYKTDAKKRGYEFTLTEEQFQHLTQQDCYYCGAKPNNIAKSKKCNGEYIYNGLDRKDNDKGYTMDNVVPCCKRCNQLKGKYTLQEFQDWIEKIYRKMKEPEVEIQNRLLYYPGD